MTSLDTILPIPSDEALGLLTTPAWSLRVTWTRMRAASLDAAHSKLAGSRRQASDTLVLVGGLHGIGQRIKSAMRPEHKHLILVAPTRRLTEHDVTRGAAEVQRARTAIQEAVEAVAQRDMGDVALVHVVLETE